MGWITLSLRKLTLKAEISSLTYQDIQLSRQLRGVQRHLAHEQSIHNLDKKAQLKDARANYDKLRKERPSVGSEDYEEWKIQYAEAQEQWQQDQEDINDYYDDIMKDLEEQAQDQEEEIQQQQTEVETQRDAMQAELEALQDQIKTEIQNSAIKF